LALSEWPTCADLDEAGLALLAYSYVRRKRFEAQLVAAEMTRIIGAALGTNAPAGRMRGRLPTGGITRSGRPFRRVSTAQLFDTMGVKL